jgi:hypothetical protein
MFMPPLAIRKIICSFDKPLPGFSQKKFQSIFKNPFVGAPRTVRSRGDSRIADNKRGKGSSAMGCSPHEKIPANRVASSDGEHIAMLSGTHRSNFSPHFPNPFFIAIATP